ncbi:MAG: 30S ribosome-binding factor RbfA [Chloroflexi bacterium]|nr:30S ribosome-binding factor RbfA [Chloroflexota bacterium]
MPVPGRRQERLNELLHQELSELLSRTSKDPRLQGFTVTRVETTADLRQARVYVTFLGTDEEKKGALQALDHARGFLRSQLASRLEMRFVPEVSFHLDPSLERGQRILDLLRGIESQEGK